MKMEKAEMGLYRRVRRYMAWFWLYDLPSQTCSRLRMKWILI